MNKMAARAKNRKKLLKRQHPCADFIQTILVPHGCCFIYLLWSVSIVATCIATRFAICRAL